MAVMTAFVSEPTPQDRRWDEVCDELAELVGQQNVIAARITELLAVVEAEGRSAWPPGGPGT